LMVQPLLDEEGRRRFPMPAGNWRSFTLAGEDPDREPAHPVLRLRPGAILPVGPGGQTTVEASDGPLTLLVSLSHDGKAEGRVYEDDGDGFGYAAGDYLLTTYEAVVRDGEVEVRVARREGSRAPSPREIRVHVL